MSNLLKYKGISVFHPGYYIEEIVEDMGISQAEFATRMGTTTKTLSCLINGQANISNDLAKKLSIMLGTSSDVWLNLQSSYDQKLIEIQKLKDFEEQESIIKMMDYNFFVHIAGLPDTRFKEEKVINLCKYLKIADLRILLKQDFLVNYRMGISDIRDKNIINSRAWVQTAINLSHKIETQPYDSAKLKSYLLEIRNMTLQDPEVFLPRMRDIFAQCGVAFVLLPHLKNSGVNGAVKWISDERVVLAINNRGLDADKFWFSLFHEIKHVLQRKIKTVFISYDEKEMIIVNNQLEDEADRFAANILISPDSMKKFNPTKYTTDDEIIDFAHSIGLHPGIVAGRLQHDRIIPPNRCSKLKEKYIL